MGFRLVLVAVSILSFAACKKSAVVSSTKDAASNANSVPSSVTYRGTFTVKDVVQGVPTTQSVSFDLTFNPQKPEAAVWNTSHSANNPLKLTPDNNLAMQRSTIRTSGLVLNSAGGKDEEMVIVSFLEAPFQKISSIKYFGLTASDIQHNDPYKDTKTNDFFNSFNTGGSSPPTGAGQNQAADVRSMSDDQFTTYYRSFDFSGNPSQESIQKCALDSDVELNCKTGNDFQFADAWACSATKISSGETLRSACFSDTSYDSSKGRPVPVQARRNYFDACMACGDSLSDFYNELNRDRKFRDMHLRVSKRLAGQ